ncbi:universal stress protein [Nonomuraea pusilla]|uniref:universal stress protein n=1 Tax=Nonomuraea pusilla TaxID=46177 RepID=UPI00332732C5
MTPIVLGYDGSDFSVQALDWALDEAELRRLPLVVAHAWQWPYGDAADEDKAHLRKAAEHVLWHGAECARSTGAGVQVTTDLYEGPAARRLVELSADAALVVVGSRGLSELPRRVLGSVAGYVAANARCPVIVVRGPGPLPAPVNPGPVVIAEEEPDDAVLGFAFGEAAMRQLTVAAADPGRIPARPGVEVRAAREGETATLLVVGRAGRPVDDTLVQHAPCPVAVVGG